MRQFTIVVKPFRTEAVLKILTDHGISAFLVREAKGYSRQKGYLERYVGSEYSLAFLPKVEITLWLKGSESHAIIDQIIKTARTGRIGDGKIFVVPLAWDEALEF
jgi:nitrogen regulatory protein P-II 2